jgi:hypothetical protein
MRKKISFIGFFLMGGLLCLSSSAWATSPHEDNAYLVSYHFGKYYNGEAVRSVHVKTGILIKESTDRVRERWVDEQEFTLQAVGDHFFGKAVLEVHTSPYIQQVISPVVIYSLELANGQKRIAGPFGIALQNRGNAEEINSGCYYGDTGCAKTFYQALQELNASLAEISDASATVVKKQIHGSYAH